MRIETIQLEWFRGAADTVTLPLKSKSMVVYGENGSGKTSFVDAIEYVLKGGKIDHLSHEYSGKHQEKGVINTHTPEGKKTALQIKFKDGSALTTCINRSGRSISSGAEAVGISSWDYRRTVLRQDELAAFIRFRKGEKYSALLPLLGLHQMEVAAENLRQLVRSVAKESKINEIGPALEGVATKRRETFGAASNDQVLERIKELHTRYCPGKVATSDPVARCKELETAINARVEQFSADQNRHFTLQDAAHLNLKAHVKEVRSASVKLAEAAEPLIAEKLEVLQSSSVFVDKLEDETEVKCPACGRSISAEAFQAHITDEKERLQELIHTFDTRKAAIGVLCDALKSLKSSLGKAHVKSWCDDLAQGVLADNFTYLDGLIPEALRTLCTEDDLESIENNLVPLIDAAATALKDAPPDVQQLHTDKQAVKVAKETIEAKELAATAARAHALVSFLESLEQGVREEIRQRSTNVVKEISSDIQSMWAILHPGKAIEEVQLYIPEDADKAIDIRLKFHGLPQDSPRLTLSEGYRNSLGLCIFLAMAKREESKDRPLFLDDVVVSFDRDHRGMIVELLEKQFSDRQVIVFTHDRDWYIELRRQLDQKNWDFRALRPYENPGIGIRWSDKTWTFDDARALLKKAPDSAGNTARKIMDIELATLAERLKLRLPYLYREKNDHRTSHEFLSQLISAGKKCFDKKGTEKYEPHEEAIQALGEADKLLVSWGNKASHTFDITLEEATKLITACESALEFFICPDCKKNVYKLDDGSAKLVQCGCGHLRWRYGKA